MHDVAGRSNIAGNMVEKGNFCRLIGMGFHAFRLINDDDMLILIEFFDQTRVSGWELFFRVIVRVKDQLDLVSFLNGALPVDGLAIDQDVLLGS